MKAFSSPEPLESRIAPAGVVGFFFDPATKSLALNGDAEANQLTITEITPGILLLIPDSGTQLEPRDLGGVATGPANNDARTITGFGGDLGIDLGDDDDTLRMMHGTKMRDVTVKGFTILSAALNAFINGSTFLGTVGILGGTNADNISIASDLTTGNPAATTFAKAVTISLSTGADAVGIGTSQTVGKPIFKSTVGIDGGVDADVDTVSIGTNPVFRAGTPTLTNIP